MSADEFRSILAAPATPPEHREAFYEAWDDRWDEFCADVESRQVGAASGQVGGA